MSLGKGRVSLETVTSEDCQRNMDPVRLPVSMPGDRTEAEHAQTFSVFCLVSDPSACSNFLGMKHAPGLIGRTCLAEQGALRCIVSGTGATR
jgi:hypothetical protein